MGSLGRRFIRLRPRVVECPEVGEQVARAFRDREVVWERGRAFALRVGQAEHLGFVVVVRPDQSQKLPEALTAEQDRATQRKSHFDPNRGELIAEDPRGSAL